MRCRLGLIATAFATSMSLAWDRRLWLISITAALFTESAFRKSATLHMKSATMTTTATALSDDAMSAFARMDMLPNIFMTEPAALPVRSYCTYAPTPTM